MASGREDVQMRKVQEAIQEGGMVEGLKTLTKQQLEASMEKLSRLLEQPAVPPTETSGLQRLDSEIEKFHSQELKAEETLKQLTGDDES